MGKKNQQVVIRVEREILDRLDGLIPALERVPEMAAGRVTRSSIARLALGLGVAALEKRHGKQRP